MSTTLTSHAVPNTPDYFVHASAGILSNVYSSVTASAALQPCPVWVSGKPPFEFETAKIRGKKHGMGCGIFPLSLSPLLAFLAQVSFCPRTDLPCMKIQFGDSTPCFSLEQRGIQWSFFLPPTITGMKTRQSHRENLRRDRRYNISDAHVVGMHEFFLRCSSICASQGCMYCTLYIHPIHCISCQTCQLETASYYNRLIFFGLQWSSPWNSGKHTD